MFANILYCLALITLSPLIAYRMIRYGRYRRGLRQKLFGLSTAEARRLSRGERCIWLHAVSVGEVNLLPGLVRQIHAVDPGQSVVVSTSTDTGYDLAVKRFGQDRVFFCPLDFTWAVRRTIRHLGPRRLVLAELELWPNLIRIARRQSVAVHVVNGRLSERSAAGYQRFTRLTRPIFESLTWVGCQDETSAQRFIACGASPASVNVTGSLKFDDAPTSRETPQVEACSVWAGIDPWHRVWVVGSTQSGEEAMALSIYGELRQRYPDLRLILIPRHPERFDEVARLIQQDGYAVRRRSQRSSAPADSWDQETVILVDTIGELRHWWGVGQIATVGGSFGDRGGQNMLEPAGYGSAVSFGPCTRNFAQIAEWLIEADGAVRVKDHEELRRFVERCLTDIPAADALGRQARALVNRHRGATARTVQGLGLSRHSKQAA